MVFSSSTFLFAFLPVALVVYFLLIKRELRNIWLLVVSLAFYAWGEPVYVLLLLVSIAVNYLFAICMAEKPKHGEMQQSAARRNKAMLILAVVFNIAVMGFFKYEGFLAESINSVVGSELVPVLELALPIGISFYTLQALSYVIDVYRGQVPAQRNILHLGMYIACFPQLIAGPIVRYKTVAKQILHRKESLERFTSGLRLFVVGLAKKVLLANVCALLADKMLAMGGPSIGAIGAWAGLLAYTFQIFFDFSGYSDMAIGLGRMMGFEYLRNFNYPYISKSIAEFWRRWHISLYAFFRDYVYIPLGGSRVSTGRWVVNALIVWGITGLWHGAAWHYVLWGLYYGVLLIGEKLIWGKLLAKLPGVIQHLYAIFLFMLGWLIFWLSEDQLPQYAQALVGGFGLTGTSTLWELTVWEYIPVFALCTLASTPLIPMVWARMKAWIVGVSYVPMKQAGSVAHVKSLAGAPLCSLECVAVSKSKAAALAVVELAVDIAVLVLLAVCCASLVSGSYNPFIYFQF